MSGQRDAIPAGRTRSPAALDKGSIGDLVGSRQTSGIHAVAGDIGHRGGEASVTRKRNPAFGRSRSVPRPSVSWATGVVDGRHPGDCGRFCPAPAPHALDEPPHVQQHHHRGAARVARRRPLPRPQAAPPVDDRPRRRDRRRTVRRLRGRHRRRRAVDRRRLRPLRPPRDAGDADAGRDVGRVSVLGFLLRARRAGDRPVGRLHRGLGVLGAAVPSGWRASAPRRSSTAGCRARPSGCGSRCSWWCSAGRTWRP
jgi:hypothetical protein